MGQIEITDAVWKHEKVLWLEFDGPVTIETLATVTKSPDTITSRHWLFKPAKRAGHPRESGQDAGWVVQVSGDAKTPSHTDNAINFYPDTLEEALCRFTAQIVDYEKPVSFSPHSETLKCSTVEH